MVNVLLISVLTAVLLHHHHRTPKHSQQRQFKEAVVLAQIKRKEVLVETHTLGI